MGTPKHTREFRPRQHVVAVWWKFEGYGGGKPFTHLWDAQEYALKLLAQGYDEVHVQTTTTEVFKLSKTTLPAPDSVLPSDHDQPSTTGDQAVNKTKGRPPILAPKEAEAVRRLAETGVSAKQLSEAFKVSLPTIRSCIQRVGTYQS